MKFNSSKIDILYRFMSAVENLFFYYFIYTYIFDDSAVYLYN